MQSSGDMTFDNVNTWQIKSVLSQHSRLESQNLVGIHMRTKLLYVT